MEANANNAPRLADASKRLAQHALVIFENRVELFLLEIQEERERITRVFQLTLVAAIFALLAGITLNMAIVVACWQWSPLGALLILTAVDTTVAGIALWRVIHLRRNWQTLPATFEELRKDRECLERIFQ